jgi:hypothetical protein
MCTQTHSTSDSSKAHGVFGKHIQHMDFPSGAPGMSCCARKWTSAMEHPLDQEVLPILVLV